MTAALELHEAQEIAEELAHKLCMCGFNAVHVLPILEERNITGIPNSPCKCPIARLFKSVLPGYRVRVWSDYVTISDVDITINRGELFAVDLPVAAQRFIQRFDNGYFPALIAC
jgi:hypothetical protein